MSGVAAERPRRLEVFLVRPTKYDDQGYLLRHRRGVLPSNTLACLHALSHDAGRRPALRDLDLRVHLVDESVQAVPERRMLRAHRNVGTIALLALVGVQTSQFPRAMDLALRFRRYGLPVLVGGFHVSGRLAVPGPLAAELQTLVDAGVTLVGGEVEEIWEGILCDAIGWKLAPRYQSRGERPSLETAPVPRLDARLLRRFVDRRFGTIDASRGCPFSCSFCTIIHVHGRNARARAPGRIAEAIRRNHATLGLRQYFFTDDDFARNPLWRETFRELIALREREGIALRFLMQVDTLAHRLPDFVPLARDAGCFQVFLGIESLDPIALREASKRQNRVAHYAEVTRAWHEAGILAHAGYIVGFPDDTPETVLPCVRRLRDDLGFDLASFFMLSPLPGSSDYARLTSAGTRMDDDLNRYDTFHAVTDHPRMSGETWSWLYREAWDEFYTQEHMRRRLASVPLALRTTLLQLYLWYRTAIAVERFHPMMTGFFRVKPRLDRRPGFQPEGRVRHLGRRARESAAEWRGYARVLAEIKNLWSATEPVGVANDVAGWARFLHAMVREVDDRDRSARPAIAAAPRPAQATANASPQR